MYLLNRLHFTLRSAALLKPRSRSYPYSELSSLVEKCPMLLSTNEGAKYLRQFDEFLLVESCVINEHPLLFEEYAKDRICPHVCIEAVHMNMAETKLACIMKIHNPSKLVVLTVDGSPHCLQLHVLAEDMQRYFNLEG